VSLRSDVPDEVTDLAFRPGGAADAAAIAALHADSWRRHYRGAYADAFLDHEAGPYCAAMWAGRLEPPRPETITIVAEQGGQLVGLAHTVLGADPGRGALLDNLHVRHGLKRRGIGTRLLALTRQELLGRAPRSGLYLHVLVQNAAAQAFYAARGGACVGRGDVTPPGGGAGRLNGRPQFLIYAWPSLAPARGGSAKSAIPERSGLT
jgi:ribosomal protein S18 acetylase RimI-like enzyme